MVRWLILAIAGCVLASCSNADGPYGYGYAVNERPSLAQLGLGSSDGVANSFRSLGMQEAAAP